MRLPFLDRTDAGRELAKALEAYADRPDVIVLALPRGGVPVGYEVAHALRVPLDIITSRKLGVPGHEELAMGAIASGGVRVLNEDVVQALRISPEVIDRVAAAEHKELERREHLYRDGRPAPSLEGKTVLVVDDGLATGASMRAAVASVRQSKPARIVVAVPVAAPATYDEFLRKVDEVVCLATPEPFYAVGSWFENFGQTTDDEVRELLARAERERRVQAKAQAGPTA